MSNSNDKKTKGVFEELKDAFNKGYNKNPPSKESLKDQAISGISAGITEAMTNPIKWLASIFK